MRLLFYGCESQCTVLPPRSKMGCDAGLGANEFGLDAAGDLGLAFAGDHVDLAADAEFAGEVEAGFDGEAGVGRG